MSPVQVYFPTCIFCNPGESFDFEFVLTPRDEPGVLLVYCAQYVLSLKKVSGPRNTDKSCRQGKARADRQTDWETRLHFVIMASSALQCMGSQQVFSERG